jgi:hypothetical protein
VPLLCFGFEQTSIKWHTACIFIDMKKIKEKANVYGPFRSQYFDFGCK